MLQKLRNATKVAALATLTTPGNISWIIGEACPRTPMPAVTLSRSMDQRSQNCLVLIATCAVTPATAFGVWSLEFDASGLQSGGGTRTRKAPNIITTK